MRITFEKLKELDFVTSEAYKTLRTNILFCGEEISTIAITSSTENEGKSNVSFDLARAFAEDNKKVLLIDADNRKSVLEARLGVDKEVKGLSHYLTGMCELREVIYQTNIRNLDLIFPGAAAPNPSELLGKNKFAGLLEGAGDVYDYVLVDCPPIGTVIDAAVVAKQCDGALFVIESETISYHMAKQCKEQLEKSGCRILGAVLNKVEMRKRGYGYNRYYSRYYRKYYGKYYGR